MADGLGVQNVLQGNLDGGFPLSFAETPDGRLLMANGIDPVLIWDGTSGLARPAGLNPPATAPTLGGMTIGSITGKLVAWVRFVDGYGNVSNLSPMSNIVNFGTDGFVQNATYSASGAVTVTAPNHGLTGATQVIISGCLGMPQINGTWAISVVDSNTFTISNLVNKAGVYTGGGVWTQGMQTVVYGSVPTPADPQVVRRQILRNVAGNAECLYVDIDTTDLASTSFTSTSTDADLLSNVAVPLTYGDDDLPFANRNGLPPSHKQAIAAHKGRIFLAGDTDYSVGHAEPTFNSTQVKGVGTKWKANFAYRLIYLDSATQPYQIASVDPVGQVITLTTPYLDSIVPFTPYTISPDPAERRLMYFTEPGLPESWPEWNAVGIPEDEDNIVALVPLGQYLYVVENRHIYRFTFQDDPDKDGYSFLSSNRGSLSNRTWIQADVGLFMMDEIGVHLFNGDSAQHISQPIQSVFQQDGTSDIAIDWDADQTLWHAAYDPGRDTIRWFVTMSGYTPLIHAIAYNYRTQRWWIEQYPIPMSASTNATLGRRRSLAGTSARRVICLSEGSYDGSDGTGTTTGSVTASTSTTITDSSAAFEDLESVPIAIIAGTGKGQQRIVAENTATAITVVQPWDVLPDTTSVYQVGGIGWYWRSGWFRYQESEEQANRDVELVYIPSTTPNSMDMQIYYDHSVTPEVWQRTIQQDGVTLTAGSPDVTVDLAYSKGWAKQRFQGHADPYADAYKFISVQLSGFQSGSPLRLSQLWLNGCEES
jgi:hypothetical protein